MRIRMMTDLHYALHADPVGDSYYKEYLKRFFGDGPAADRYVSLGDLTQNGTEREYRAAFETIDSLGRRDAFLHIPGNHDLLEADCRQTEQWGSTPPVSEGFGAVETESTTLLFLNSCQVRKPLDWGGRLDGARLQLLGSKLAEANGKPVLVFAHHPLPDTTALSDRPMMRVEEAAALTELMNEATGPCFWFNGHNHIQSIVRKAAWTCVQTASALCLPCYREVIVSDDAVKVTTTILNDPALEELAERSLDGFPSFHRVPPAKAAGSAQDQSIEVRFGPRNV
ncbi:metallophosphoesterase family protein [Paenibacillus sp. GYB003]|uniref:metallophosphoesterase family protein n=1 Tax=Paenibacillus sp. GYB003 TaxID=2994392 RepID=UPI002F962087